MRHRPQSAGRTGRIPTLRLLATALALLIAVFALHTAAPAGAASGVPLPTAPGSEWIVIAGYNAYTHTAHDPDALDIVRLDAPTAGSQVLSPVAGSVRYAGGDCISVEDAAGMSHLLCHLFPLPGFERGDAVVAGQLLGQVAPDGLAGNNGISHIHYAIHHAGQGPTGPFRGVYALEGIDLHNSGAWNEHADRSIVSSNHPSGVAPAPASPSDDASPPDDEAPPEQEIPTEPPPAEDVPPAEVESGHDHAPASIEAEIEPPPPSDLQPGWNLVAWPAAASVSDTVAGYGGAVDMVLAFDATMQRYDTYSAFLPDVVNSLSVVAPGQAVWLSVESDASLQWQRPDPTNASPRVRSGFNLVAWMGPARGVTEAIAPIAQFVRSVHTWDAEAQRFWVYRPGGPAFLNDLVSLHTGDGVWVEIRPGFSMSWSQR